MFTLERQIEALCRLRSSVITRYARYLCRDASKYYFPDYKPEQLLIAAIRKGSFRNKLWQEYEEIPRDLEPANVLKCLAEMEYGHQVATLRQLLYSFSRRKCDMLQGSKLLTCKSLERVLSETHAHFLRRAIA